GIFYDQNHNNFNAIYYANTLLADRFIAFDANDPFSADPFGGSDALRRFLAESFPFFPDLSKAPAPSDIINRNDPRLQTASTFPASAVFSRQFSNRPSVHLDYVYAHGKGIPLYIEENIALVNGAYVQPDPRFNTIATLKGVGKSDYNAGLLDVTYRAGKGSAE